jgi:pimeloyl-ACP methyl ester carboxylesterase
MTLRELHISFEGHEIAVISANEHIDEPAIVFIPGVLAPINFWQACLPPSILKNRRWYSVSLPGHHPSQVPENYHPTDITEDWLNRLYQSVIVQLEGDKSVVVAGHSTGGFAALNLAANGFNQLLGIISIAGFYKGDWGGIEGQLVTLASLGKWAKPAFLLSLACSRKIPRVQAYISSLLAHDRKAYRASPLAKEMLAEIQENMQNQNLSALFPLFNRIPSLDIYSKLKNIQVPTTIMVGSHDPVIDAAQSLSLIAAVNEAHPVVFEQAGHMLFMECNEQFNQQLCQTIDHYINNRTRG